MAQRKGIFETVASWLHDDDAKDLAAVGVNLVAWADLIQECPEVKFALRLTFTDGTWHDVTHLTMDSLYLDNLIPPTPPLKVRP